MRKRDSGREAAPDKAARAGSVEEPEPGPVDRAAPVEEPGLGPVDPPESVELVDPPELGARALKGRPQ
ncbi:hypothetical protein SAMN02990966_05877 [Rhodospirillales bacterium URHD0017]|nr:hypothetical protein SAMN02990966_05877 [Rhodospirillales bacterium URHD0017]